MNIAIVGTGYVGLVSGVCFSEIGVNVTCVDINENKIEKLKNGIPPIYEDGLHEMLNKNISNGRLKFSTSLKDCINDMDVVFIAVGTPPAEDGSADLSYVYDVAKTFGENINKYSILVTKSTVPVGTTLQVKKIVHDELKKRNLTIEFDVASNPEFLKEGVAIKDFMSPDRVVIGTDSEKAKKCLSSLYRPFMINNFRVIFMDILSSEMTKYVSNAMLATRISFMNEVAKLCEYSGADVSLVREGVGSDTRIGNKFLYPGCGYGGSCFPKDISALIKTAKEFGHEMKIITAVEEVNDNQKQIIYNKLLRNFKGNLKDKKIAIWGLSFKPGTDDIRDSPALVLIESLLKDGAQIKVNDPAAMSLVKEIFENKINYCDNIYETVVDADAVTLVTEWKDFRIADWTKVKGLMKGDLIIDGRNIYDRDDIISVGLRYEGIGRGKIE